MNRTNAADRENSTDMKQKQEESNCCKAKQKQKVKDFKVKGIAPPKREIARQFNR